MMHRTTLSTAVRYGAAVLIAIAAFGARSALSAVVVPRLPPFITLYPGIVVIALLFGMGPGLLASAIGALLTLFVIYPGPDRAAFAAATGVPAAALFLFMGVFMSVVAERYRRERQRAAALERQIAISESETRFRETLDSMMEGCQIIGRDFRYVYLNEAAAGQGQSTREKLVGRTMMECYPGIDSTPMFTVLRRSMDEGIPLRMENEFALPDGSVGCFELSFQPVPEGVFIVSSDISERRRAQREIQDLNAGLERRVEERTAELKAANEELEAFAYAVSHDLRAPLRALNGFSHALLEDHGRDLKGEARSFLEQIITASTRMGDLIEGILRLSRISRGEVKRQDVDLTALAEKLVEELAAADPRRHVDCRVQQGMKACCDPALVEAMLLNLLGNSWKYTARTHRPQISFTEAPGGGEASFRISDNGAGFDMSHAARLFQPFQRLHRQDEFPGIGIGLATVQRIVKRHGGSIRAEGVPGKGASFTFSLVPAPQAAEGL